MVRRTLALAAVLVLAMTMGCSTTQKWMAGGAVVGGTVGGIWAANGGYLNAGEGIAVGAVTGAAAAGLIGNIIEEQDIKELIAEKDKQIADLTAENTTLKGKLADANKKIAVLEAELAKLREQLKNSRTVAGEISLGSDVLFRPGSAMLSAKGKTKLDEAAATIEAQYKGKFIMVEGHTDDQPIKLSSWKSNFELGSARALAVLHYLTKKGVDPANLSAGTFSQYQPIAANDTKEGRQQNRRAIIVIYTNWKPVAK